MDILKLINDLYAALADAQAALDKVAKENYDKGFAAGVASVVVGDKIYSQEEADALVAAAVMPLNEKIVALEAQVAGFPAFVKGEVDKAKAELKAAFVAAYDEDQAKESAIESGLKDKILGL